MYVCGVCTAQPLPTAYLSDAGHTIHGGEAGRDHGRVVNTVIEPLDIPVRDGEDVGGGERVGGGGVRGEGAAARAGDGRKGGGEGGGEEEKGEEEEVVWEGTRS